MNKIDIQTNLDIVVKADDLRELSGRIYQAAGVPKSDADTVSHLQVETDLRGIHSHGTRAQPGYVRSIMAGRINPKAEPKILREGLSFALVDGGTEA